MSQGTVTVSPPRQTLDDLTIKSRLQLGSSALSSADAPTVASPATTIATAPTLAFDGSNAVYSGVSVSWGFVLRDDTQGLSGDLYTTAELDFSSLGDGQATITDIPALAPEQAGLAIWLVRIDPNLGSVLVANVTGLTTYTDDGNWNDYFYGENLAYFNYAIGFEVGGRALMGATAGTYGFWAQPRELSNFPATPAGATRWLLWYDGSYAGAWLKLADVTNVSTYSDAQADPSNGYQNFGYWSDNNPSASEYTPSDPPAKESEVVSATTTANAASAQITSHVADTNNPHNVTIGQIGAAAASHTHAASAIVSGTIANARIDATTTATASKIVLRDANADTAVRVLTAGAISGTIYSSSANGIVLNRNASSSTGDFLKYNNETASSALFRVTNTGAVICSDVTGGNFSGSKFSGSNHTLTQGSTEEVTFVPGGNNMNLTFAAGRAFQLFMGSTIAISVSSAGVINLAGITIDSTQKIDAAKLSLHQGFTAEMDWTLNGGNMPLTIYNSRNFTITNGGATKLTITGSTLGFFGSAASQQTGGAATAGASYTATEQSMLQKAYNALRSFGLLS